MKPIIDIIIPTWNNGQYFVPCVESIAKTGILNDMARLIVINNGSDPIKEWVKDLKNTLVLEPGENLGWERGLQLGLEHSDARFVVFQNDDTFIPRVSMQFYQSLLIPFLHSSAAAVGPVTTVASGMQSIFHPQSPRSETEASYLIFFCVMIRREALDKVGGIDLSLPGGDDFDLSIRLRQAGYHLVIQPNAFLIHHGFKSGERLRGGREKTGGWNSPEMIETTANALIRKHGLKTYLPTMWGLDYSGHRQRKDDLEGDLIRTLVDGDRVVELGCGPKKTVPHAVGVDIIKKGDPIPHLFGCFSIADIQADVFQPLPLTDCSQDVIIARHLLEHALDVARALINWNRVLKLQGRLIVAVPDEEIAHGIPMNPEHVHAFTARSLKSLMSLCGFSESISQSARNGVSFVGCYEKIRHIDALPCEMYQIKDKWQVINNSCTFI